LRAASSAQTLDTLRVINEIDLQRVSKKTESHCSRDIRFSTGCEELQNLNQIILVWRPRSRDRAGQLQDAGTNAELPRLSYQ
jgi:hypothetical protein